MDDSYKNETITETDKNWTVVYNVLLAYTWQLFVCNSKV